MRNNNHNIIGWMLVAFCVALFFVVMVACLPTAGASTPEPTARDWQRLNVCANASIRPDIAGKEQEKIAIKCASVGKAVAAIKSGWGKSKASRELLNGYGIMSWKNGKRHLAKFKTTKQADMAWAQSFFDHYSKQTHKQLSTNWTGESWAVKHYTAFLNKWVPQFEKLYQSMK